MAWGKVGNIKGKRGTIWFNGSGAPGTITGAIAGDYYIDNDTGDIYNLT